MRVVVDFALCESRRGVLVASPIPKLSGDQLPTFKAAG